MQAAAGHEAKDVGRLEALVPGARGDSVEEKAQTGTAPEEHAKEEVAEEEHAKEEVAEENKDLRGWLAAVGGVKPDKIDKVLAVLADNDIEDVDDLEHLETDDVDQLGLSVLHSRSLKNVLQSMRSVAIKSVPPQFLENSKFAAPTLVLGPSTAAAKGIMSYLGLTDLSFTAQEEQGLEAMMAEWLAYGTPEDIANVLYVIRGKALEPIPDHIQECIKKGFYHGGRLQAEDFDTGNKGKTLHDFVNHPNSKMAGNTAPEVTKSRSESRVDIWFDGSS